MASDNPVDGREKLVVLLHAFGFPLTSETMNLIGIMGSKLAGEFEEMLRIRILTNQMMELVNAMETSLSENDNDQKEINPPDNVLPFKGEPAEA